MYPGWLILNVYTLLLAVLLLIFQGRNCRAENGRAFVRLVGIMISLLVVDSAGIFSSEILRLPTSGFREFCSYYIFAFDPLGYLLAIHYIDQYVDSRENIHKKRFLVPMQVCVTLNIVLVTASASLDLGWFYSYTNGIYARGPLFMPRAVINFLFCIWVQAYVIHYRGHINPAYRVPLACFPCIVLLGGLLQIIFAGLSIEYMATILACLILFTYVQRVDLNADSLTGTLNRRGLDTTLEKLSAPGQKPFGSVMIDLDFFKEINDQYGHNTGDEALVRVAEALVRSFPGRAAIGRYGGDEFMVFLPETTIEELEQFVRALRDAITELNQSGRQPYQLQLSIGYDVYDAAAGEDIKTFQQSVDERMYREKEQNHLRCGYSRGKGQQAG